MLLPFRHSLYLLFSMRTFRVCSSTCVLIQRCFFSNFCQWIRLCQVLSFGCLLVVLLFSCCCLVFVLLSCVLDGVLLLSSCCCFFVVFRSLLSCICLVILMLSCCFLVVVLLLYCYCLLVVLSLSLCCCIVCCNINVVLLLSRCCIFIILLLARLFEISPQAFAMEFYISFLIHDAYNSRFRLNLNTVFSYCTSFHHGIFMVWEWKLVFLQRSVCLTAAWQLT